MRFRAHGSNAERSDPVFNAVPIRERDDVAASVARSHRPAESDITQLRRGDLAWIAGGIAIAAAAIIGYDIWQIRAVEAPLHVRPAAVTAPAPVPASTASSAPTPSASGLAHSQAPVGATSKEPLPALDYSDALLTDALTRLLGIRSLGEYFHAEGIVRRIVATVDNLPRGRIARRIMIAKPAPGSFLVQQEGVKTVVAAANAERYARYVALLESIDVDRAVALYRRLYPLFQRAYEELGYPKSNFNDRLIEVIDDLLAAPDARGPIELMQPKVLYEFQDPMLESMSAGQKILLRIGADNEARVKAKIREARRALTKAPPS